MFVRRLVSLLVSLSVVSAPLLVTAAPARHDPRQNPTTPQQVVTQSLTVSGQVLKSDHKTTVADVHLRLRNVTTGVIVGRTISDKDGNYSFTAPEPGIYVVEAVKDDDKGVQAVTDPFPLPTSEPFTTNVILPARKGLAVLLTSSAFLVLAAGAGGGIIAILPPTVNPGVVSPER